MFKILTRKIEAVAIKALYRPLCRIYSRRLGDEKADAFFKWMCSLEFLRAYGFWPNFKNPNRFSEKLWHRMLNERNALFTLISDKLKVRDYIKEKIGSKFLIPLLWSGLNPDDIPFDKLPNKFVIKANHGCGYNIIVNNKEEVDFEKCKRKLIKWLNQNFAHDTFLGIAWGYRNIHPAIIIEEFLNNEGKPPVDYKFYCFGGNVEIVTLHFERLSGHLTRAFTRNFIPYQYIRKDTQYVGEVKRPKNFDEMVWLAETLADEFAFMRVDLYSVNDKSYFGELTPYPGGVSSLRGFDMLKVDKMLGGKWKIASP